MKKVLGITGGIGAGKSYVTDLFRKQGATVVDADKIARDLLEPQGGAYSSVLEAFGTGILCADGRIDRKELAKIVFSDKNKLEQLNRMTHPKVFETMQKEIADAKTSVVCLDVPLLFSCDFPIFCDRTIAVLAPREVRIARVMERDGCKRDEVLKRMEKQLSDAQFQERADISLWNDGDSKILQKRVEEIFQEIMEK